MENKNYVSEGDFLLFLGVLCATSVYRFLESKFFYITKRDFRIILPLLDHIKTMMRKIMSKKQFYLIKSMLPFMFADQNTKDLDPLWMIYEGIEAFNIN